MSDLLVLTYPTEQKAFEARKLLVKMKTEHRADLADAVVAVVEEDGHVRLDQLVNQWTVNTRGGALIGLLYGMMFLHPAIGAAIGAGAVALGNALSDYGIDDAFMTKTAKTLKNGQAALFIMLRAVPADDVMDALAHTEPQLYRTKLDRKAEAALEAALDKLAEPVT